MFYLLLLCCMVLSIQADQFHDYFNQGVQAFQKEQFEQAVHSFDQALSLHPDRPELLYNLGCCHIRLGQVPQAIVHLKKAISLRPEHALSYVQIIPHLQDEQDAYSHMLKLKEILSEHPDIPCLLKLGRWFKDREKLDEAISCFLTGLEAEPDNYVLQFELALIYTLIGQTEKSIFLYNKILEKHPDNTTAIYNSGYAYKMQGDPDKAVECYQHVLRLDPNSDSAHFALGMAYLIAGDYERGWTQHERFLKQANRNGERLRTFLAEGTTDGKTILLQPEGGLGDTINFVRYARELKRYGIKVIVMVQKPLYTLLKNCDYIDCLVPTGKGVPHFDEHTTLMSIGPILYSHEHELPPFSPYIFPDDTLITQWKEYMKNDHNFKIGLCWEASVYNDSSRPPVARRGMPLSQYYILSELNNVSLYSLQQMDGTEQIQDIPPYVDLHVFDESFDKAHGSFMDTAAVIQQLDLVLTVDTAIAHLAGAMGKRVWLLLPWATDWRWITGKTTSPWYPTMRIFQQPKPFDWDSVIHEVFIELIKELT